MPELVTPAGVVGARQDGEFSWIEARAEWAPPRTLRQYGTAAEVDALPVPAEGRVDLRLGLGGRVRPGGSARAGFPGRDDGIEEDEATGAAALLLTDRLGRALNITQGAGHRSSPLRSRTAGWRSAAGSSWSVSRSARQKARPEEGGPSGRPQGSVRISAPVSVTTSVCSNWAVRLRSLVTTVQPSSHMS